ncbi:hypothetical protein F511_22597 [Dorcoceras hygrometricum]|uniref:Uncharacterized protein n=1 Tax=Dorcoceras hygrometricum TaxID=472368 RepID=A0A2Z7BDN3_9LAMI|nr:hypothetical protein F511_22597 [Dorcoceras hygrometricum]
MVVMNGLRRAINGNPSFGLARSPDHAAERPNIELRHQLRTLVMDKHYMDCHLRHEQMSEVSRFSRVKTLRYSSQRSPH